MNPLDKVNYEPWVERDKPQNWHRTDPTGRSIALYTGERDWFMNKDYILYVAVVFMAVLALALYLSQGK